MTYPRISWNIIGVAALFLICAAGSGVRAEPAGATEAQLTAAPWKVTGSREGESWVRTFNKDGTFTTDRGVTLNRLSYAKGTWSVSGFALTLTFDDKRTETLPLPLNPHGMTVTTRDGHFTYTQLDPTGTAPPPPETAEKDKAVALALLTAGSWRCSGSGDATTPGWVRTRVFNKDGTFTTLENDLEKGTWVFSGQTVVLVFHDGHHDVFSLPLIPAGTFGTDAYGGKMVARLITGADASVPVSPQASFSASTVAGASPEDRKKVEDIVADSRANMMFAGGEQRCGVGFIAAMDGRNYLFSPAHVVAGMGGPVFNTLNGAAVPVAAASLAVGADVFCMATAAGGKPFEVMKDVQQNVAVGDAVVALVNDERTGAVLPLMGKITGIGSARVEIDAPIHPGNAGSPIIHLKSGKVIAIVAFVVEGEMPASPAGPAPVTQEARRFGCRIDIVKQWQPVDWRAFSAQAAGMKAIAALTHDLISASRIFAGNPGEPRGLPDNPAFRGPVATWNEGMKRKLNEVDKRQLNAGLASSLKVACQMDVTAARRQMTYDFFQRALGEQQQMRDELAKSFDTAIKGLQK